MGITRGQLKKLGFKSINTDLEYKINKESYLVLGKNKTVIYHVKDNDNVTPLVHLDETGFEEMLNFLMNLKNSSLFKLKNQIEDF